MIDTMPGLVFGFVDNAVLIGGAYTGYEVDRFFKGNGSLGMMVGASLSNTVSDALGAVIDPAMAGMAAGIIVGCLLPMLVIPVIEKFKKGKAA